MHTDRPTASVWVWSGFYLHPTFLLAADLRCMDAGSRAPFLMLVFAPCFWSSTMIKWEAYSAFANRLMLGECRRLFLLSARWWCNGPSESWETILLLCCTVGVRHASLYMHSKHMKALSSTSLGPQLQGHSCKNPGMHTSMYVHTKCWWGSSYILSRYLWKHDFKSLNYESGQTLCLLTPHYTHSPLSRSFQRDRENASR